MDSVADHVGWAFLTLRSSGHSAGLVLGGKLRKGGAAMRSAAIRLELVCTQAATAVT